MSTEQSWKELNNQEDKDLSALLQPGRIQQLQSSNPLQKIKQNLLFSTMWCVVISVLYVVVIFYYPYWQIVVSIGVILVFTVLGGYSSFEKYRKINKAIPGNLSLLPEMEKHYHSIRSWIDLQLKAAVFIYPFGCCGGFMAGLMFSSGKTLADFMNKPRIIVWMLVTTIVIVPIGLWLAKRLLNKSYGQHLNVLKKNIDDLKMETPA